MHVFTSSQRRKRNTQVKLFSLLLRNQSKLLRKREIRTKCFPSDENWKYFNSCRFWQWWDIKSTSQGHRRRWEEVTEVQNYCISTKELELSILEYTIELYLYKAFHLWKLSKEFSQKYFRWSDVDILWKAKQGLLISFP